MEFFEGQKLNVLFFPGEDQSVIRAESPSTDSICVSMVDGPMASVPFAKVILVTGDIQMWNIHQLQGVEICPGREDG